MVFGIGGDARYERPVQAVIPYMLVGIGGAVGSMMRYGVGRLLVATAFPWATLMVNVGGGLAMGLLAGFMAARMHGLWGLLLGVGLLGGFTTFSAFSLELSAMIWRGAPRMALFYALLSVALSLTATLLGLWLARISMG